MVDEHKLQSGLKEKVLIVASKPNMIQKFNRRNIKMLQNMGFEVHVATNVIDFGSVSVEEIERFKNWLHENNVVLHQVDFGRKLGTLSSNLQSVRQLDTIFKLHRFRFTHVHSPLGSILGRLVAKKHKVPVMYTAHGFHFLKNGPTSAWLIFFPLEWFFSFITDTLITINDDDYSIARRYMHARNVVKINGIGVDIKTAWNVSANDKYLARKKIRDELNIPEDAFVISSVGELNDNKNHRIVLEAIKLLPDEQKDNIYYLIAGVGENKELLTNLAKTMKFKNNFKLIGYRSDIHDINYASDVAIFPSYREGLGIAGLDAVVDGTYLIGSNVRGIKDYIFDETIGKIFQPNDAQKLSDHILEAFNQRLKVPHNESLLAFDTDEVDKKMAQYYSNM
ncbi:glycosyltransferase [Leuconostoc lactis]|uniref:glycosyltransferase n=1 Tax=Leuconostoc lactis TaxID=1246 RepID=UPI001D12290C|nr:glycosyltransferase [Leuconostoc lactis]MCC2744915.1 glycosyltransferase [Leuconostoc lactis]MCC2755453.1 glycosyltransferase [Leuconostoc lactis]